MGELEGQILGNDVLVERVILERRRLGTCGI